MKYVIYCRRSTDTEDKQVMSLPAQEQELRQMAERDGLEVVAVFHESMSAKAPGRPQFAEMLSLISKGKADGILCWKLDRLARNPIDGGSISWMLQQNQIRSIKTHDREYLPSDNVILMSFEFGMSNQAIRDLSMNVKRGNRQKLRDGGWPNHAPFGYRNDKSTKTLLVHPEQARKVRKMYRLYNTGQYSLKQIAKELGERKSLVERILKKTFYYGVMERDGEYFPGKHEPIITKDVFEEAQIIREGVTRPRPNKLFFPYRGFMTCAECGCQLTATKKKGQYDYYYCTNGKGICTQYKSYLNESETNSFFVGAFNRLKFEDELIDIMYESARESLKIDHSNAEKVLADIELELRQNSQKERRLYDKFEQELVSEELYLEKAQKLKAERLGIEKKKRHFAENSHSLLDTLEPTREVFLEGSRATSEFLESDPERKHQMIEKILWNLEVKDKNVAQYNYKDRYAVLAKAPKNGDLATMLAD